MVEEIDDDQDPTVEYAANQRDRIAEQVFGLLGINDAIYRREDRTFWVDPVYSEEPGHEEDILTQAYKNGPDGLFDNRDMSY